MSKKNDSNLQNQKLAKENLNFLTSEQIDFGNQKIEKQTLDKLNDFQSQILNNDDSQNYNYSKQKWPDYSIEQSIDSYKEYPKSQKIATEQGIYSNSNIQKYYTTEKQYKNLYRSPNYRENIDTKMHKNCNNSKEIVFDDQKLYLPKLNITHKNSKQNEAQIYQRQNKSSLNVSTRNKLQDLYIFNQNSQQNSFKKKINTKNTVIQQQQMNIRDLSSRSMDDDKNNDLQNMILMQGEIPDKWENIQILKDNQKMKEKYVKPRLTSDQIVRTEDQHQSAQQRVKKSITLYDNQEHDMPKYSLEKNLSDINTSNKFNNSQYIEPSQGTQIMQRRQQVMQNSFIQQNDLKKTDIKQVPQEAGINPIIFNENQLQKMRRKNPKMLKKLTINQSFTSNKSYNSGNSSMENKKSPLSQASQDSVNHIQKLDKSIQYQEKMQQFFKKIVFKKQKSLVSFDLNGDEVSYIYDFENSKNIQFSLVICNNIESGEPSNNPENYFITPSLTGFNYYEIKIMIDSSNLIFYKEIQEKYKNFVYQLQMKYHNLQGLNQKQVDQQKLESENESNKRIQQQMKLQGLKQFEPDFMEKYESFDMENISDNLQMEENLNKQNQQKQNHNVQKNFKDKELYSLSFYNLILNFLYICLDNEIGKAQGKSSPQIDIKKIEYFQMKKMKLQNQIKMKLYIKNMQQQKELLNGIYDDKNILINKVCSKIRESYYLQMFQKFSHDKNCCIQVPRFLISENFPSSTKKTYFLDDTQLYKDDYDPNTQIFIQKQFLKKYNTFFQNGIQRKLIEQNIEILQENNKNIYENFQTFIDFHEKFFIQNRKNYKSTDKEYYQLDDPMIQFPMESFQCQVLTNLENKQRIYYNQSVSASENKSQKLFSKFRLQLNQQSLGQLSEDNKDDLEKAFIDDDKYNLWKFFIDFIYEQKQYQILFLLGGINSGKTTALLNLTQLYE
ncbi:hypothetical protein PPERSA_02160 [Pseudocohnilembus persalinus]|uniref:Uncharacterized protein n=1 Tax=Pseudocohnilembus persalinus TaxID=266149 RepID=A0A0V0Q7J9_PSEPJ|nr:hypothetical protein PPERSA_02160 [Pseudocohnilembus persalinus]|eukprot:KRW98182.1 hypothetical protein PPERSA_02160 [Pseudocohnilembus persalinus]